MFQRTWDYEGAHRETPDEKTMTVVENFRPWEEKSQAKAEQKRMQTTVLSEKERKHSLIMFRKICQASGVLPTLRIDLYAGDKLKSVCNPYVVFEVKGCKIQHIRSHIYIMLCIRLPLFTIYVFPMTAFFFASAYSRVQKKHCHL
jgi:hypothetical protein